MVGSQKFRPPGKGAGSGIAAVRRGDFGINQKQPIAQPGLFAALEAGAGINACGDLSRQRADLVEIS